MIHQSTTEWILHENSILWQYLRSWLVLTAYTHIIRCEAKAEVMIVIILFLLLSLIFRSDFQSVEPQSNVLNVG